MKEKLNTMLSELDKIIEERKMNVTDFQKLDICVRILNTNETNKDYKNPIRNDFKKNPAYTSKDSKPTKKQIYVIEKSGKVIPAGLTRKEASKIIENLKGEKK